MILKRHLVAFILSGVLMLQAEAVVAQTADRSDAASNSSSSSNSSSTSKSNPNSANPPAQSGIHEGSDFKIGPVTDDSKLIKPVAGENQKSSDDDKPSKPSSKSDSEEKAGMHDQRKTNFEVEYPKSGKISIGALKVARDIEIYEDMMTLERLKETNAYGSRIYSPEVMSLRIDLNEQLMTAFAQTRRVMSELDRQISGFGAVAKVLEDERDQAIRTNNILNFTTNGSLAATQGAVSIGTPTRFQNLGNELGVVAGGLTVLISAYALKVQKGGKRNSERDPNMLAPIFNLVPAEPNKYPPIVWNYLNDYEPEQKLTRREQLIQRWKTLSYLKKKGEKSNSHLEELCGTIPLNKKVTIAMLRTRIPMLEDLRATVSGMNEYLDEIMTFLRNPNKVPVKYHASAKSNMTN